MVNAPKRYCLNRVLSADEIPTLAQAFAGDCWRPVYIDCRDHGFRVSRLFRKTHGIKKTGPADFGRATTAASATPAT
jgi:hypothetical protein